MATTDTPKRSTAAPLHNSGGGMTLIEAADENPVYRAQYHWLVARLSAGADIGPPPIPPDDYARHWNMEGPR